MSTEDIKFGELTEEHCDQYREIVDNNKSTPVVPKSQYIIWPEDDEEGE